MNIVLLTGKRLSSFKHQMLESLLASNHKIVGCLVDDRPKPSLPHRLRSNLRKGRGGYTLIMALSLLAKKEPGVAIRPVLESQGVPVYSVRELASETSRGIIRDLNPDVLVLLGGFGIVKPEVAATARLGILSYHHGNMRKYRGQPPCVWELYNGEREMGVTVQRLGAGLDNGNPIVEITVPIERTDTVKTLRRRAFAGSIGMMREALELVADPRYEFRELDQLGAVYTLPNLRQYVTLNLKILCRRLAATRGLRLNK
jgi:folate-dependent phosphoribosylglycinamide formyltransferase PurN